MKFLKAIYLNENVFKLNDIETIVEYCEMQKENETILSDLEFRRILEKRLTELDYREQLEYHCSGQDEKELRKYKVRANEIKVYYENMKKGLEEILNSFKVGEKKKTNEEEPQTYYEMLCRQAFNK